MLTNYIIYTFFRIINASIIFALFCYVFKNYMYPWINSCVLARINRTSCLLEKSAVLQSNKLDLEVDIKRQKRYAHHVSDLTENWNEKVDESIRKRLEEKKSIDRSVQEHLSKRAHSLSKNMLIRDITPVILDDVRHDLEKLFESDALGSKFIDEIVHYFESQEEVH